MWEGNWVQKSGNDQVFSITKRYKWVNCAIAIVIVSCDEVHCKYKREKGEKKRRSTFRDLKNVEMKEKTQPPTFGIGTWTMSISTKSRCSDH